MTTRQFDPVFSAALRNELEALADAPETTEARLRPSRPLVDRPQLWVSLVTAVVLAIATIGVLRLTHAVEPAQSPRVVDPLSQITDPSNDASYVARAVTTLIAARGTGTGTHSFDVPAGVTDVRVYLDCAPEGHQSVDIDGNGGMSGDCSRTLGGYSGMPITAGSHTVTVSVKKRTAYALLIIAEPAPTVSTGALVDPAAAVQDRRNPDALPGDTNPLLSMSDTGSSGVATFSTASRARLRAYFVCRTSSASAVAVVDGHLVRGCMNSIAHWFDFTPTTGTGTAQVQATGEWALLVVPAPSGAKDSPAAATLPYPEAGGTVLAKARGTGAPASGTYRKPGATILLTLTCHGTGWLEISTGDGGTNTRGNACSTRAPDVVGFGGEKNAKTQRWTVVPHGDISWTFQLSNDD